MKSKLFKPWLRYSNRERKSFFYLFIILFVFAGIYIFIHFQNSSSNYHIEPLTTKEREGASEVDLQRSLPAKGNYTFRLFDPNRVDFNTLVQMGIPSKTANNWIKYLQKGGRFKNANELKKIYGLDTGIYRRITPYLSFTFQPIPSSPIIKPKQIEISQTEERVDPNLASVQQLIAVGFSSRFAHIIDKYRSKGGTYRQLDDLLKIYGMTDSILEYIAPYLIFQPIEHVLSPSTILKIDMNLADTTAWKQLPGIGSVLAKRITGFRDMMGGFHSPDQLREVYGLKDSTFIQIQKYLAPSPVFRKIRINEDLPLTKAHPYLSVKDSRIIANYIAQNGSILNSEQLNLILAFDGKYWEKLLPYLDFSTRESN